MGGGFISAVVNGIVRIGSRVASLESTAADLRKKLDAVAANQALIGGQQAGAFLGLGSTEDHVMVRLTAHVSTCLWTAKRQYIDATGKWADEDDLTSTLTVDVGDGSGFIGCYCFARQCGWYGSVGSATPVWIGYGGMLSGFAAKLTTGTPDGSNSYTWSMDAPSPKIPTARLPSSTVLGLRAYNETATVFDPNVPNAERVAFPASYPVRLFYRPQPSASSGRFVFWAEREPNSESCS